MFGISITNQSPMLFPACLGIAFAMLPEIDAGLYNSDAAIETLHTQNALDSEQVAFRQKSTIPSSCL